MNYLYNQHGRSPELNKILIPELVRIVRQKLKEQESQPKQTRMSIEQILNDAGIHSMPLQEMAEIRAEVYESLGLGGCPPGTFKKQLQGLIFDHPVFRITELYFYFPGVKKQEVVSALYELNYVSMKFPEENEPVWRPKFMQRKTVQKQLASRPRLGNKAYFDYLSYTPPQPTDTIIKQ
ncbi:hypothetical protein SG34_029950 [Thalassomonas viridans]|uniref:Uncharacterized protein n=1 Tax=Thalassomonas viridans TaxID=137584 RepID=A0AAE9Z968_9GAMM|nr:hypothetical protein [Thalassomonas viridans]WDE09006.1 hypothetical protein SG34_029950 [Thalassomonas viridans]